MKADLRYAIALTSFAAAITVAGCADIQTTVGEPSGGLDSATWFERQRQIVDGHADPYDGAIDAPCRAFARRSRPGSHE